MKLPADFLEGLIGRRATSCLGVGCLLVTLALIGALLWPKIFPKAPVDAPQDQTTR